jgi:nucleotide-binding universal stress UspA family protein
MLIRSLLVGVDPTQQADRAILQAHKLSQENGARLVFCTVHPAHLAADPLFPQHHRSELVAGTHRDQDIADVLSTRVMDLTGRSGDDFEVIVEQGDVAAAICSQSAQVSADLVVMMADRRDNTVTRDLARGCSCSVLALAEGEGDGMAVIVLEDDADLIPDLVSAALQVASRRPHHVDVVLAIGERDVSASAIAAQLGQYAQSLGTKLVPWFIGVNDASSLMTHAARDPSLGLLAIGAPAPADLARGASSPIDDLLPEANCSILLLRAGPPTI